MRTARRILILVAFGTALSAPAARAETRTIYSSLPLAGSQRAANMDIVRGEQLALEQAGNRVGSIELRYVSLNSGSPRAGRWDPRRVLANARRVGGDESTIAYLGEFNSGASALSIPVLNEAGIPQISPSNTYVGLTRPEGGCCDEPDRYYPTGERTFARVAPADHLQAAAIARYLQVLNVRNLFLVDDGEVYGRGLVRLLRRQLPARGIRVAGRAALRLRGRNARAIARRVRTVGADAMFYGGIERGAVRLWRDVHRRNRRLTLMGGDGIALSSFARRIPRSAAARTHLTLPALPADQYPPASKLFFYDQFRARYGHDPAPYGIYGYEAMSLLLDAMRRAGPAAGDRAAVAREIFRTADRDSVLGRYSIDQFGDTTLTTYAGLRVSRTGRLVHDQTLDSAVAARAQLAAATMARTATVSSLRTPPSPPRLSTSRSAISSSARR